MILTGDVGFLNQQIVERFDCYEGACTLAKLSQDLLPQGVNFVARKAEVGVNSALGGVTSPSKRANPPGRTTRTGGT